MDTNSGTRIAFIGFGEVGQTFAKGLMARPDVGVSAWDILFADRAGGERLRSAAGTLGVRQGASAAEACRDADIVISAVTASEVVSVAAEAATFARRGQVFLDVNSAAPETKKRAACLLESVGADYVEGAVMNPVLAPGLKVPILAGGPRAAETAERLNALGMNLEAVATEYGRASAMKLCRSIVVKGLEALMVECAAATGRYGVAREVFGSLDATWPGMDWATLADTMGERVATHGIRRAAEMREAADMVAGLGRDATLIRAVAEAQARGARGKPPH
jgi:3-hydroxyisobutyrate dehydrogenase-like beta-hydroxyacid dehydrogenase